MISPINQFIEFAQEGGARRRSQRQGGRKNQSQRQGGKRSAKKGKGKGKGKGKKGAKGTRKKVGSRSRKH